MANLEEVFKLSGIPDFTFVKPNEFGKLKVSLRTPGRCLVVEGPSGIGKTTSITKAIDELGIEKKVLKLSARKRDDVDLIKELPDMKDIGIVIIDDFHRLDESVKAKVADFMKILADEEDVESKLIVIGINRAGESLLKFASDLSSRVDTIKFEANPESKLIELINKGEKALNININTKEEIVENAYGSFYIAQMLCHQTCLTDEILNTLSEYKKIEISFELVKSQVLDELYRKFFEIARKFATGPRLRREGRAPYLHLLYWLADSKEWSIQLDQIMATHPDQKGSISQLVEKGYLENHIKDNEDVANILHYDTQTHILNVEDPKFIFFIRSLLWSKFAKQVGYLNLEFKSKYDFALSFAGENRNLAQNLYDKLVENEMEIFYDKNEQHRILAANVEDYLGPIYRSEAKYVLVLLSNNYPKKIWTKFEADQFKERFGKDSVIPIWFSETTPSMFDESTKIGGIEYDQSASIQSEVNRIAELLVKKITEDRATESISLTEGE